RSASIALPAATSRRPSRRTLASELKRKCGSICACSICSSASATRACSATLRSSLSCSAASVAPCSQSASRQTATRTSQTSCSEMVAAQYQASRGSSLTPRADSATAISNAPSAVASSTTPASAAQRWRRDVGSLRSRTRRSAVAGAMPQNALVAQPANIASNSVTPTRGIQLTAPSRPCESASSAASPSATRASRASGPEPRLGPRSSAAAGARRSNDCSAIRHTLHDAASRETPGRRFGVPADEPAAAADGSASLQSSPDDAHMKHLRLWQLALLAAVFVVWHVLTAPGLLPNFFFENDRQAAFFFGEPIKIFERIWAWFVTCHDIYEHLAVTLIETVLAFAIGSTL